MNDEYTPQQTAAYQAVLKAADRIANHAHRTQYHEHTMTRRRVPRTYRFHPPAELTTLIKASSDVLAGTITPIEAIASLHYGNTGHALEMARNAGH